MRLTPEIAILSAATPLDVAPVLADLLDDACGEDDRVDLEKAFELLRQEAESPEPEESEEDAEADDDEIAPLYDIAHAALGLPTGCAACRDAVHREHDHDHDDDDGGRPRASAGAAGRHLRRARGRAQHVGAADRAADRAAGRGNVYPAFRSDAVARGVHPRPERGRRGPERSWRISSNTLDWPSARTPRRCRPSGLP